MNRFAIIVAAALVTSPPTLAGIGDPCSGPDPTDCTSEWGVCAYESETMESGICVTSFMVDNRCLPELPPLVEDLAEGNECRWFGPEGWKRVDLSEYRDIRDHMDSDLVVDADRSMSGIHTGIATFIVNEDVTLSVEAGSALVIFAQNIIIDGTISGNGRGYAGVSGLSDTGRNGNGPGAGGRGGEMATGGGGAGHGGDGGCGGEFHGGCGGSAGTAYCVTDDPWTTMGSSGGSGGGITTESPGGSGGAGGGVLWLFGDIVVVNGTITMNGSSGGVGTSAGTGSGGGGGAGGGILIHADRLEGTMDLLADGGDGGGLSSSSGTFTGGGGGGGGCVEIFAQNDISSRNASTAAGARGDAPALGPGSPGSEGFILEDGLPVLELDVPTATLHGLVEFAYTLVDAESDPVDLLVEYRVGLAKWDLATTSGDVADVSSSAGGEAHAFSWDTSMDLPEHNGSVTLRVCAADGYIFSRCEVLDLLVDNTAVAEEPVPDVADAAPDPAPDASTDVLADTAPPIPPDSTTGCGCVMVH